MKSKSVFALFASVLIAMLAPRAAQARVEVSFDYFYDSLVPYGEWVEVADYGTCWHPTDVDEGWAPYADGYWAYTDAGWTWVSYEEFGGIVYHYGRWIHVEDEGWCWQPDTEWGPAWVSWRSSDDYVGWAPLPPQARWRREIGISIWADREYGIGPSFYSFCRVRDFGAPVLRPVIIHRVENVTIIRQTVNITNITYNNSYGGAPVVFNGGPDYVTINRISARPIPALKLVQNTNFQPGGQGRRPGALNARAIGNQLVVSAPIVAPPADPAFLKSRTKKSFAAEKVTTGWAGVKDPRVREELKQEMTRQTKGLNPQTAPARPVAAADLKAVPEKADPQAAPPTTAKDQRGKPGKSEKPAAGSGVPPAVTVIPQGQPATGGTATPAKIVREKGRDKTPQDAATVVPGGPLKPFNPVADTDRKPKSEPAPTGQAAPMPNNVLSGEIAREKSRKPRDGNGAPPVIGVVPPVPNPKPAITADPVATPPGKMRESRDDADRAARAAAQAEQDRIAKQRAAAQQQQQMESQQNAARQRQQEQAAGAEREKIQAEKDRAARKQADAAAAQQQQQMESQRNALRLRQQEQAVAAERQKAQADQERVGRKQAEAAAISQQKQMEAQQQRAAQEGARRQADQQRMVEQNRADEQAARRAQEAQREQMRAQPAPRIAQPPPPAAPAQGATPVPDGGKHRKDKDKDKNGGN